MENILLKGGRVIDPKYNFDCVADVLVSEGKVKKVGHLRVSRTVKVIDVKNKIVCPGLIDMHVHARDFKEEKKENYGSMSLAAIMGGFTTVACMANTNPVVDNVETLQKVKAITEELSLINIYQVSAITTGLAGEDRVNLDEMKKYGAIAASDDGKGIQSLDRLTSIFKTGSLGLPFLLHCESLTFPSEETRSEWFYILMVLELAHLFGTSVHIQHVSCERSVYLIRESKANKAYPVKVTCETAPHYLALTHSDFKRIGANAKMNPPLRTEKDRQAIIRGLVDGTIDVIATDHAPHTVEEKNQPLDKAPFGIIGLETAVPVILSTIWTHKRLPMMEIIRKMTTNPARILQLKGKGTLHPGSDADITVIDPYLRKKVDVNKFQSLSRNCPWNGKRLQGWPVMTISRGRILMQEGKLKN